MDKVSLKLQIFSTSRPFFWSLDLMRSWGMKQRREEDTAWLAGRLITHEYDTMVTAWQCNSTTNYIETTNSSFLEGPLPMGPPYCCSATQLFLSSILKLLVELSPSIKNPPSSFQDIIKSHHLSAALPDLCQSSPHEHTDLSSLLS